MVPAWTLLWSLSPAPHRATVLDAQQHHLEHVTPLDTFLEPWLPQGDADDECVFFVVGDDAAAALRPLREQLLRSWTRAVPSMVLDPWHDDEKPLPPLEDAVASCTGGSFVVFSGGIVHDLLYSLDVTLFQLPNYYRYKLLLLLDARVGDPSGLRAELQLRGSDVATTRVLWEAHAGARDVVVFTRRRKAARVSKTLSVAYQEYAPFYVDTNRSSGVVPRKTGTEYYLLDCVADRLGLHVEWEDSYDYGLRMTNGTYVGDLLWLVQGGLDVAGLPRYLEAGGHAPLVDYTYPHAQDNYCFLVRKARAAPPEALLPATFPPALWLCTLLTVVALGGAAFLALPSARTVFHVFRSFMTGTLDKATARRSTTLALLTGATLVLNLVVLSAFQSALYSVIATVRPLRELDTLEEVAAASSVIFIHEEMAGRFGDGTALGKIATLFRKFESSDEFDAALRLVAQGDAALLHYDSYNRLLQRSPDYDMHRPRECLLQPAYVAYPVSRKSSARRLDVVISRATAAGLLDKWTRNTWYELELTMDMQPLPPQGGQRRPAPPRPLVVAHFQVGLWVLLTGFGLGLVALLLEMLLAHGKPVRKVYPYPRTRAFIYY